MKGFHGSPQAVGNTMALQHLTNRDVAGMIYEIIRVSKTNSENQMVLAYVQEHQIRSHINFLNRNASLMKMYNEQKTWPKQSTGCATYSMFHQPGYVCEFKDICDSPDWRDVARFYRKESRWHPFEMRVGN